MTPDGRLLVTTKDGRVRIIQGNELLPTPALDLAADGILCNDFERGLESIEVDPDFASNQFVYVYHTYNGASSSSNCGGRTGITNRVVRYTLPSNNLLVDGIVILGNIASADGTHSAGDLHFGADGLLYISTGDGGDHVGFAPTNLARFRSLLNGKILRITRDGAVPASNPYVDEPGSVQCGISTPNYSGGTCRETFAWGFRNPFRFAIRHGTNQLYVNDVGQASWEEISEVTAGNDYGWFCREGQHPYNTNDEVCVPPPAGMVDPIYEHAHNGSDLCAITGAAFAVSGGYWPAPYEDAYYFGDYCGNTIYRLMPSGNTFERMAFATIDNGTIVSLMFDPAEDALYYTTSNGTVGRIDYTGGANRPPTARATADPTSGLAPLTVNFSSVGSSDPDNDPLTFGWDFGDNSPPSSQPDPSHTYLDQGIFTATLVVTDSADAASQPFHIRIDASDAQPGVEILSPAADLRFEVGQVVTLTGVATDSRGIDISSSLQWNVLLHHVPFELPGGEHTHPFFSGTGNDLVSPPLPGPEDLDAAPLSFLEIRLTAHDSQGMTQTVTQTLQPERVALTFATEPAGLPIFVRSVAITNTRTITSWAGWVLTLSAPTIQRDSAGNTWTFSSWSDGGDATHLYTTPHAAATIVATYQPAVQDNHLHFPFIAKQPSAASGP
jgi:glucose/arabinose dehydrogenase